MTSVGWSRLAGGLGGHDQALDDFGDTAALVDLMDLVITVDTSVAHLAGAMGKPVWILLPTNADWRWMTGRSDTPGIRPPACSVRRAPRTGQGSSKTSAASSRESRRDDARSSRSGKLNGILRLFERKRPI